MQKFLCVKPVQLAVVLALAALSTSTWAATLTVTSVSDALNPGSGACTLRGAVAAINGAGNANGCSNSGAAYGIGDTIVFADTLAGQTVQFTLANGGQILISKSLAIQGPAVAQSDASQRVTLRGGGAGSDFRLLNVTTASTALSVQDLNFTNAMLTSSGQAGSAITNVAAGGSVSTTRCAFTNNATTAANSGGGAIIARSATISASTFSSNSAGTTGGAIYAFATATVNASTFSGNSAMGVGSGGGAVYASTVAVSNSTFNGNSASLGGAIAAATVTANASTFNGNSAPGTGGLGGAIYTATAVVSNSTFSGNSAMGVNSVGGAIYALTALTGRHLTLVDNTAPDGAAIYFADIANGGSVNVANSLIVGNNANAHCVVEAGRLGTFNGGYNLGWANGVNDTSCGATNAIDASATPHDGIISSTLLDNGGPTLTLALPMNSPAVGKADSTVGGTSQMLNASFAWVDATLDQRGFARKTLAAGRDLGASEARELPTPPLPGPPDEGTYINGKTHADSYRDGQNLQTINGVFIPPRADRGQDGAVFVFALLSANSAFAPETLWSLDSAGSWHLFSDCRVTPAYYTGTLQIIDNIPIFPVPMDLTPYAGSELYIGYGLGGYAQASGAACNNMFARKNWVKVYTQPSQPSQP